MRKDAKKNLRKVAGAVLKDPLATGREIAEQAGVSKSTAHNKLDELGQNIDKTPDIIQIAIEDLEIVSKGQELTKVWLGSFDDNSKPKREDVNTLTVAMRESQKRHSVLMGDNTDDKGGEIKKYVILDADDIE